MRFAMNKNDLHSKYLWIGILFLLSGSVAAASSNYDDLVQQFYEFRDFQEAKLSDGVPDYTSAAMEEQYRGLKEFQKRLAAMDISGWPVSQQVHYHLVRAEMNGLEFFHRALRPWARDPAFYLVIPRGDLPKMHGSLRIPRKFPIPAEQTAEFRVKLKAIPKILEQAKGNLTEGAEDLAIIGIRKKEEEKPVLEATKTDIGFGHQIRSYVFAPYTMVNDHRTEMKVGDVHGVMDGKLDAFIEAFLKKFGGTATA